jgi:hypothetical protein
MERATWTDERLDDLAEAMRSGFGRVDHDLRDLRGEMGGLRSDMNSQMTAIRTELGGQIETLRLLLLRVGGALLVTLVGVIAAILLRSA